MLTKILASSAVVLSAAVGVAAPTSADPNPFTGLSCNCKETAPAGSPILTEKIDRGIQQGLSGLPVS